MRNPGIQALLLLTLFVVVVVVAELAGGQGITPAKWVQFDDAEDLQAKLDGGDLGGGGTESTSGVTHPVVTTDGFCIGGTSPANASACFDPTTGTLTCYVAGCGLTTTAPTATGESWSLREASANGSESVTLAAPADLADASRTYTFNSTGIVDGLQPPAKQLCGSIAMQENYTTGVGRPVQRTFNVAGAGRFGVNVSAMQTIYAPTAGTKDLEVNTVACGTALPPDFRVWKAGTDLVVVRIDTVGDYWQGSVEYKYYARNCTGEGTTAVYQHPDPDCCTGPGAGLTCTAVEWDWPELFTQRSSGTSIVLVDSDTLEVTGGGVYLVMLNGGGDFDAQQ